MVALALVTPYAFCEFSGKMAGGSTSALTRHAKELLLLPMLMLLQSGIVFFFPDSLPNRHY